MTTGELLKTTLKVIEPALEEVFERLKDVLNEDGHDPIGHIAPTELIDAMRYAVLSPGKRVRPALVVGAAKAIGAPVDDVLPAACAVEMVHAYSLVHDDLPALDDDDLRRGMPSCHVRFGEATAILAGDALLTEAFSVIADPRPLGQGQTVPPGRRIKACRELARAIGAAGMVGGQIDDIDGQNNGFSVEGLYSIHRRKTGRLIQASICMGALFGGATAAELKMLRYFGSEIGLCFQLVDDLLDSDGLAELIDNAALLEEVEERTANAIETLQPFGRKANGLKQLAKLLVDRVS